MLQSDPASESEFAMIAARENEANLRNGQRLRRRIVEFGRSATIQREVTSPAEMISQESTADLSVKFEYPACPVCGGDQRHFPFRLHEPYRIACCEACGLTTFTRALWRPRCKRCIANPRITRAAPAGTQTRATRARKQHCGRRLNAYCEISPGAD